MFQNFLNADCMLFARKDYATMILGELVAAEKRMKAQKMAIAVFVGFVVCLAIWSATHKGGFLLTVILLLAAVWVGVSGSRNLKGIQAEISRRNTAR